MKGGVIVKELTEAEVRVFNNVSQVVNPSVKLGDVLQTMIQEQAKPEPEVNSEDQTSAIPDSSEIKTLGDQDKMKLNNRKG